MQANLVDELVVKLVGALSGRMENTAGSVNSVHLRLGRSWHEDVRNELDLLSLFSPIDPHGHVPFLKYSNFLQCLLAIREDRKSSSFWVMIEIGK